MRAQSPHRIVDAAREPPCAHSPKGCTHDAYAAGSMLMLVATTIDGFISTDTAALFVTKSPEGVRVGYWMIQAMAGVALTDIARVAWSLAMVRDAGLAWPSPART